MQNAWREGRGLRKRVHHISSGSLVCLRLMFVRMYRSIVLYAESMINLHFFFELVALFVIYILFAFFFKVF